MGKFWVSFAGHTEGGEPFRARRLKAPAGEFRGRVPGLVRMTNTGGHFVLSMQFMNATPRGGGGIRSPVCKRYTHLQTGWANEKPAVLTRNRSNPQPDPKELPHSLHRVHQRQLLPALIAVSHMGVDQMGFLVGEVIVERIRTSLTIQT